MKRRFIRPGGDLTDDTVIVVRGGALDDKAVVEDALTAFDIYGVYAISVVAIMDTTLDDLAKAPPLVRFEFLTLMTVGAIRQVNLRLVPSGRWKLHYSIDFDALEPGVGHLRSCEHRTVSNPYHVR